MNHTSLQKLQKHANTFGILFPKMIFKNGKEKIKEAEKTFLGSDHVDTSAAESLLFSHGHIFNELLDAS